MIVLNMPGPFFIPPPEGALLHGPILPSRHSPNCEAILGESSESDVRRDIYRGHAALLDSLRTCLRSFLNPSPITPCKVPPPEGGGMKKAGIRWGASQ